MISYKSQTCKIRGCEEPKWGNSAKCYFHTNEKPKVWRDPDLSQEDDRFFRSIWNERPHFSEVSGIPLGDIYKAIFMSHILTKQAYPAYRHFKLNLLQKTPWEHRMWENYQPKLVNKLMWAHVFERKELLLSNYPKIFTL